MSGELEKTREALLRRHTARIAPRDELAQIHPAVRRLAVMDPRLGLSYPLLELPLRAPGPLAHAAQEGREGLAPPRVLTLGGHGGTFPPGPLDTSRLSSKRNPRKIAERAVEAGIEFDAYCGGEVLLHEVK